MSSNTVEELPRRPGNPLRSAAISFAPKRKDLVTNPSNCGGIEVSFGFIGLASSVGKSSGAMAAGTDVVSGREDARRCLSHKGKTAGTGWPRARSSMHLRIWTMPKPSATLWHILIARTTPPQLNWVIYIYIYIEQKY
jgi:hypothetical protein